MNFYYNYKAVGSTLEVSKVYRNQFRGLDTDRTEIGPFETEEEALEDIEQLSDLYDSFKEEIDDY